MSHVPLPGKTTTVGDLVELLANAPAAAEVSLVVPAGEDALGVLTVTGFGDVAPDGAEPVFAIFGGSVVVVDRLTNEVRPFGVLLPDDLPADVSR